jgi:pimeloyl-ACP methyl ester carboxylesterase
MSETWFFLRGLVRESGHWNGFLENFAHAFPHRKVVALDIPGAGPKFQEPSCTSISATMESLRAEFAAQRGEKNYLFAVSLGAMVGVEWLHQHPKDFGGAVLVNTSLRGLSPLPHRLRPQNYGALLSILMSGTLEERERKILEITSRRPEMVERWAKPWAAIQAARPVSKANALRQLLAAARYAPPRSKPAVPVLILNGGSDGLVNPDCSQRLAKLWDAPLKVEPSAGHDLTLDAPAWVIEQLKKFP